MDTPGPPILACGKIWRCFNLEVKRYAFIDVPNTDGTANKFCGFSVDWGKLALYLNAKWECKMTFFYVGIEQGDEATAKEFEAVNKLPCATVRTKPIFAYKQPDRRVATTCAKCGESNIAVIDMGYKKKANCDVDLTLDALNLVAAKTEQMFFTGDGDFAPLMRDALAKGVEKIHIVSSMKTITRLGLPPETRFSKNLKGLLKSQPERVNFVNLDNLKFRIQKDAPAAA